MSSMTPTDVGGAFLGALFGEVFKIVEEETIKATEFKPLLNRLLMTLNQIAPIIEDIDKLNRVLDQHPNESKMLADKLEEGKRLVQKCARVRWWNLYAKTLYANRLIAFDRSLVRFFNNDATSQILRDGRKIQEMVNLIDERLERIETRKGGGGGVYKGNTNGYVGCCLVPKVGGFVVGFEEPVREVKALVMSGGEQQVVVVSAPEGWGKTTLVKMVCHDEEIIGMFKDNIFFVTAPKTPSLKVVIESLFEHGGFQVPEFQTDEEAIYQLERMLKQIGPNPLLLVLDDVWSGWESLIEDLTTQIPEIKILVTSRFVFPRFESTYKLKLLSDKDAMALFRHSAFPKDGKSSIPDDLVDKIVRGCGGFPLALKDVGRSLYGEPEEIWKQTLKQWSEKSVCSSESNNEILIRQNSLQTSLNSSFPKDGRSSIPDDLVDKEAQKHFHKASLLYDQLQPVWPGLDFWYYLAIISSPSWVVSFMAMDFIKRTASLVFIFLILALALSFFASNFVLWRFYFLLRRNQETNRFFCGFERARKTIGYVLLFFSNVGLYYFSEKTVARNQETNRFFCGFERARKTIGYVLLFFSNVGLYYFSVASNFVLSRFYFLLRRNQETNRFFCGFERAWKTIGYVLLFFSNVGLFYFSEKTVACMLTFLFLAFYLLCTLFCIQPYTDFGALEFLLSACINQTLCLFGLRSSYSWLVIIACIGIAGIRFCLEPVPRKATTDEDDLESGRRNTSQ